MGITGKGRCNLTNAAPITDFIGSTPGNGKFLYSVYQRFTNEDLLECLHSWGLETKVERGGRVFPQSDSAVEVRKLLYFKLKDFGVHLHLEEGVTAVAVHDGRPRITTAKGRYFLINSLLLRAVCLIPLRGLPGTVILCGRSGTHDSGT